MKKLILFLGLSLATTLGMAQVGSNGYHNGHGHHGGNVGINSGAAHGPPTMSQHEFQQARQAISRQRFERDRLRVAKQITRGNLLRSVQVQKLTRLFNFESSRLDYAKFAYNRVIDPDRYYLVNEAFRFSSSVRNLDNYIATQVAYGQPVGGPATGASCGTTTSVITGSHGSTTYSGSVTVTSGHGGMGINHGAPAPAPAACGMCQTVHAMEHMCPHRFNEALSHIKKQCFDSDKLRVAKQALRGKLLSVNMIMDVMSVMTFDDYKLDFAKWAYLNTYDQDRFYLVSDGFTFSSSGRELDWYIRSLG